MDLECQLNAQETGVKPSTSSVITKETPLYPEIPFVVSAPKL